MAGAAQRLGAARARIGFALSRNSPAEPAWKLDLEPEAAGVNVFGAELPKVKLENLAGRFSTSLAAGRPDRRPGEIAGGIQIGRVAVGVRVAVRSRSSG